MNGELLRLVESIERNRDIAREDVLSAIESALASACRKSRQSEEEINVTIDRETGEISAEAEGEKLDISTAELGRIAAQSAKQVMIQKIREAESEVVFDSFKDRSRTITSGSVVRTEGGTVVVKLGKTEAFLPDYEQVPSERYYPGDRIRVMILDVRKAGNKVKIIVSRTHPDFVIKLFEAEIPEIQEGVVEIKDIAREPGKRSKVAVFSSNPKCDSVGACLGVRGMRVRNIINELRDEKLDIIRWNEDLGEYVKSALRPAQVNKMVLNSNRKHAVVLVDLDQLSIAIGKGGQNVRLASKLVGWEIDVMTTEEYEKRLALEVENIQNLPGVGEKLMKSLLESGYDSLAAIATADPDRLAEIKGLGKKSAAQLIEAAREVAPKQGDQTRKAEKTNYAEEKAPAGNGEATEKDEKAEQEDKS
jgi:N utilization substance protein A